MSREVFINSFRLYDSLYITSWVKSASRRRKKVTPRLVFYMLQPLFYATRPLRLLAFYMRDIYIENDLKLQKCGDNSANVEGGTDVSKKWLGFY